LKLPLSDAEVTLKLVVQMISSAQTREKSLKIFQYCAKLAAYLLVRAASDAKKDLGKHFDGLAKNLSTARRFFKFCRWFKHFEDIADARAEKSVGFKSLLYMDVVANVVADISEDITSFEKVGVLKKGVLPKRTEYYANWCQFVLAVVEIAVTHIKASRASAKANAAATTNGGVAPLELRRKSTLATLELSKFYADLIKAFWDCELSFASELAFCLSGLWAALVSTHKYALKVVK